MNGIDPRLVTIFGIWTSILLMIAGIGPTFFEGALPAAIAAATVKWCSILGAINSVILTGGSAFASAKPGPMINAPPPSSIPTIVKIVVVALALSFLVRPDSAAAQVKKPQFTGDIVADTKANLGINRPGSGLTGNPLGDIVGALDVKLLPDLQYALKLATASGSKVTGPCYQAWIDIINVRQKAVQDNQTPPQALELPDPHLVTDFEKLVELRNSLQPDSEFMLKCSPVASMVKKDIIGFIGIVISGGAGLATLVPGL